MKELVKKIFDYGWDSAWQRLDYDDYDKNLAEAIELFSNDFNELEPIGDLRVKLIELIIQYGHKMQIVEDVDPDGNVKFMFNPDDV